MSSTAVFRTQQQSCGRPRSKRRAAARQDRLMEGTVTKVVAAVPHARHGLSALDIDRTSGQFLLSGGGDRYVAIHDVSDVRAAVCPLVALAARSAPEAHSASVETLQWFPHDTGMFASSDLGGTMKLWDTNRMRAVFTTAVSSAIYQHAIAPVASAAPLIALATADPHVYLHDVRAASHAYRLSAHRSQVYSVAWSPESEWLLASGGADGRVVLWDVRSAVGPLVALDRHSGADAAAHAGAVNAVVFTRDGRSLLSFARDNAMRLWSVCDGGKNQLVHFDGLRNSALKKVILGLNSAGNELVYVPVGNDIACYDVYTGVLQRRFKGHFSNVLSCVLHPYRAGEMYSGSTDPHVFVWRAKPCAAAKVLSSHTGSGAPLVQHQQCGTTALDSAHDLDQDDWDDV